MDDHCCLKDLICGPREDLQPVTVLQRRPGQLLTTTGPLPDHGDAASGDVLLTFRGMVTGGVRGGEDSSLPPARPSAPLVLRRVTDPAEAAVGAIERRRTLGPINPTVGWFYDADTFYSVTVLRPFSADSMRLYRFTDNSFTVIATLPILANSYSHAACGVGSPGALTITRVSAMVGGTLTVERFTATSAGFSAPTVVATGIAGDDPDAWLLANLPAPEVAANHASLYATHALGTVQVTAAAPIGGLTRLTLAQPLPPLTSSATFAFPSSGNTPDLSARLTVGGKPAVGVERDAVWISGALQPGAHALEGFRPLPHTQSIVERTSLADRTGLGAGPAPLVPTRQPVSYWRGGVDITSGARIPGYLTPGKLPQGRPLVLATDGKYKLSLRFDPVTIPDGAEVLLYLRFQKPGAAGVITLQTQEVMSASSTWAVHSLARTGRTPVAVYGYWQRTVTIISTQPDVLFAASIQVFPY